MIHVLTVHWHSSRWIDVQLRYLSSALASTAFRTYTLSTGISNEAMAAFDFAESTSEVDHATKLNRLAVIASDAAETERDWLVFLDGDAFPVANFVPFVTRGLAERALVAVQRRENLGDLQPHPCFCVVEVGTWADLEGDWRKGHEWRNSVGDLVTDVGGELLKRLEEAGRTWLPMLRSNRRELHAVWFGVYENLVYHHGAGFRDAISRRDLVAPSISIKKRAIRTLPRIFGARTGGRLAKKANRWATRGLRRAYVAASEEVFGRLEEDPEFYRWFLADPSEKGRLEKPWP